MIFSQVDIVVKAELISELDRVQWKLQDEISSCHDRINDLEQELTDLKTEIAGDDSWR